MTRPDFTPQIVQRHLNDHYDLQVTDLVELGGYADQNFLVRSDRGQYLFKIHDRDEPIEVVDLQVKAVSHLVEQGVELNLPETLRSQSGRYIEPIQIDEEAANFSRLLQFVPGLLLAECQVSDQMMRSAGTVAGALDHGLKTFCHAGACRAYMKWDLRNAAKTCQHLDLITDHEYRRISDYFLLQFESWVRSELEHLPLSVTHNDCHRYALLVAERNAGSISGVIDFGDTTLSHTICHLAVVISDLVTDQGDILTAATSIVQGYNEQNPLTARECDILYFLIGLRLAMYLSMAALSAKTEPENPHPQLKKRTIEDLLSKIIRINPEAAAAAFRNVCGLNQEERQSKENVVDLRNKYFSKSLYTHYCEPVYLKRGVFQYLYTDDGRTYTDLVNNVCQLGHCHPTIARAAQKQIATLNTNSRYLYDEMGQLAERLISKSPPGLDTVFFVNSGSEANDLAMRLARAYTGQSDIAVIDTAYHGNSSVCTDISPNRIDRPDGPGLPHYVHKIPVPDSYRGKHSYDDPERGRKYAAYMETLLQKIYDQGKSLAAFYAESLIGTGGQIVLPPGYLEAVYDHVHRAGGICIADEVQVGFGRIGSNFWCFETQKVVPDIITAGKPIANGHPMGVVITRREIADAFDNGISYFNTFGGNPVSCATANAVLDVLEREDLLSNVCARSEQFFEKLRELQRTYSVIGDVRGLGLYIGIDLVSDRIERSPASSHAKFCVESMKASGFLTNTNGYSNNILKIKPPLLITEDDTEQALDAFEQSLVVLKKKGVM